MAESEGFVYPSRDAVRILAFIIGYRYLFIAIAMALAFTCIVCRSSAPCYFLLHTGIINSGFAGANHASNIIRLAFAFYKHCITCFHCITYIIWSCVLSL